jgi:ABC-type branched-subunit amino acid transport system substrate-binding protein
MMRRHPRRRTLTAWYDLEADDPRVTAHIGGCARCATLVRQLAAVDAAVNPTHWTRDAAAARVDHTGAWRATPGRGLLASFAIVAVALAATVPAHGSPGRFVASAFGFLGAESNPNPSLSASSPAAGGSSGARAPAANRSVPADGGQVRPLSGAAASDARERSVEAIRLAIVVPTRGPDSAHAADVIRAVRAAVDAANASGGVNDLPVQLQVVAAEALASTDLSGVSAFVGGWATSGSAPWLMPSGPSDAPDVVVAADPSPAVAGKLLGDALAARNPSAVVGVVRVTGAATEAELASGFGQSNHVVEVVARPDSGCDREINSLQAQGATALAIAAPAGLAARCLNAAASRGWSPADGLFVPPTAAYSGLAKFASAAGAETVLGLPWPTSPDAGARRFRARTGSTSYAAEAAFAATELAVQVSRASGTVTLSDIAAGTWSSDLYDYVGTTSASARIVQAHAGGWRPVPA